MGAAQGIAAETTSFLNSVFEFCPEGLLILDGKGVIRGWNLAMERLTEWTREEVVGRRQCLSLLECRWGRGEPMRRSCCPGLLALSYREGARPAELLLKTKGGREIAVSATYGFLPAASSPEGGYAIGAVREIAPKPIPEDEIGAEAIRDALTGLYNDRSFLRQLGLEMKRAERYRRPLSLMILDIDHFKHYNDLHGRPQGNEVLKRVARLIRENTRSTDVAARYGGEGFAILSPETEKRAAVQIAQRLCSAVREARFPFESEQPEGDLTVSVGMANYPSDAEEGEALIEVADSLLDYAKRRGRDSVRWRRF